MHFIKYSPLKENPQKVNALINSGLLLLAPNYIWQFYNAHGRSDQKIAFNDTLKFIYKAFIAAVEFGTQTSTNPLADATIKSAISE